MKTESKFKLLKDGNEVTDDFMTAYSELYGFRPFIRDCFIPEEEASLTKGKINDFVEYFQISESQTAYNILNQFINLNKELKNEEWVDIMFDFKDNRFFAVYSDGALTSDSVCYYVEVKKTKITHAYFLEYDEFDFSGYSIVDPRGVQHIWDLDAMKFLIALENWYYEN